MPRPSTIAQLAPDILERLHEMLRDPRISQLEATRRINEILAERGEKPVFKSSVNRYWQHMEEMGQDIQQSREAAEVWIAKMGTLPESKVGQFVNEVVRTLSFEVTAMLRRLMRGENLSMEEMPEAVKMIKDLAITQHRLEQAQMQSVKRDQEIRKQEREKSLQEAAERVDTAAQARGLSKEDARFWREQVLMGM